MADGMELSWLDRLKRHYIGRWVIPYAIVIGFVMQIAARVFPYFGWSRAVPALVIVLVASLPVMLVLTWLLARPRDATQAAGWQHQHRALGTTVSLVVVLLAGISGYYAWRFSELRAQHLEQLAAAQTESGTTGISSKSIAVLPFENLSADKNNEYFVAGIQSLILTKLADISGLKVISRTSTAKYASHPENLKTIGQQLGVATILEGSVQTAGNQVLINVQLIDTRTDDHLWAEAYTRTLDNVFGVEGEVAEQIAAALQAKLSSTETAQLASSLSSNSTANDLFLRAEYQINQGNMNYDTASWKAAIPLYRQAIENDPGFAPGYARLSFAESILAWFGGGGMDVQQLIVDARNHAEQAFKLGPNLPAAQLALGYSAYWGRGDYDTALKFFAAALALRPNDADALAAQGFVQRRQGHFGAAITSLQQAVVLDPRNSSMVFELGQTEMAASRYPDAEYWLQQALTLDPHNRTAKSQLSNTILYASGDIPRALAVVEGDEPVLKLKRVGLLILQRKYHEALVLLDSVPDTPDNFSDPKALGQAELYSLLGDTAHARPRYAQALPKIRAQLARQQGITQAFAWQSLATTELGLGRTTPALAAMVRAQAISDRSQDHTYGPQVMQVNARLYARARRPDLAVPLLAKALAAPGIGFSYSPVLLWLDPAWDPIRSDPRFAALLNQYAKYQPAITGSTVPAASSVPVD